MKDEKATIPPGAASEDAADGAGEGRPEELWAEARAELLRASAETIIEKALNADASEFLERCRQPVSQ